MKINIRIFNKIFNDGEWYDFIELPDDVGRCLAVGDIISSQMLRSFPQFNSRNLINALKEEEKEIFYTEVKCWQEKYHFTESLSIEQVWVSWLAEWCLEISKRCWYKDEQNKESYYLEIWLEEVK